MDRQAVAVYSGLALASTGYALWLDSFNDAYHPRWTWATVVGGNSLIIAALGALALRKRLPAAAFWSVVAANAAAGLPVIAWQVVRHTLTPSPQEATHA